MKKMILCSTVLGMLISTTAFAQDRFTVVTQVVDAYPVLSPDGEHIVFTSNRTGRYQIYVCDSEGGDLVQLTDSEGSNVCPVWSPDGGKIVFASERDSDSEIYLMNADGSGQKRLTYQAGDDSHPKFSPDGKRIIFNSARTSPDLTVPWSRQFLEIFTMDLEGKELQQITAFESVCTYPSFSPDGSKIAFRQLVKAPGLSWSLDSMVFDSEVFVMNRDGSDLVNVSRHEAYDGWPVWMADSNTLLFTSNRGGRKNMGQLYRAKLDGGHPVRISDVNNSFIQASVSKDGNTILAQRNWETETYEYGHVVKIPIE